jgi:hypothetical protein
MNVQGIGCAKGIGCATHIFYNTLQTNSDILSTDVRNIVNEFCDFTDAENKQILRNVEKSLLCQLSISYFLVCILKHILFQKKNN